MCSAGMVNATLLKTLLLLHVPNIIKLHAEVNGGWRAFNFRNMPPKTFKELPTWLSHWQTSFPESVSRSLPQPPAYNSIRSVTIGCPRSPDGSARVTDDLQIMAVMQISTLRHLRIENLGTSFVIDYGDSKPRDSEKVVSNITHLHISGSILLLLRSISFLLTACPSLDTLYCDFVRYTYDVSYSALAKALLKLKRTLRRLAIRCTGTLENDSCTPTTLLHSLDNLEDLWISRAVLFPYFGLSTDFPQIQTLVPESIRKLGIDNSRSYARMLSLINTSFGPCSDLFAPAQDALPNLRLLETRYRTNLDTGQGDGSVRASSGFEWLSGHQSDKIFGQDDWEVEF